MNIYPYFNNTWQYLKGFFQKTSIEQSKNLTYESEENKEAYSESHSSPVKEGEKFSSRILRLILKN